MKKAFFILFFLVFGVAFAQTDPKAVHPKVKEYSLISNEYTKYQKLGKTEPFKDLMKMYSLAEEINCLLTLEQAKRVIPFSVENKMRARDCGSAEYPTNAVLNELSVTTYKAIIDKMMK